MPIDLRVEERPETGEVSRLLVLSQLFGELLRELVRLRLGRRSRGDDVLHLEHDAAAAIDHLMDLGPPPALAMARDLPSFRTKKAMRLGLDLAPPNWMIDAALMMPPMRRLAQQVYFHRRNPGGVSFDEFERRLFGSATSNAPLKT